MEIRMGRKSKKKIASSKKNFKQSESQNKRIENDHVISVCLIVKNEEKYLDNCLKSIKDVASEVIIVDTGSTDRTVEIAKRYTDKIYFHAWEDSFSEARNHYLKYATGDWIFQMDADEELIQEDIPVLMAALKEQELDAVMVQIVSKFQKGKREAVHSFERIFRNNGLIHYEGRIHERLVSIQTAKVFPIRLNHYGYDLNKAQSKKKFDRTVSLLKMDLQEDTDNPITYHYLSCSYLGQGMWKESLDNSLMAIRLAEVRKDPNMIYLWSHYNAAMSCYRLKELNMAEDISISALKKYPHHIDAYFILSLIYFDQKRWSRLIKHGNEYIRLIKQFEKSPETFGNLVTNSISEAWNVKILVGMACFEMEQFKISEKAFEEAIACAPEPLVALRAIGIFFYNKKDFEKAFTYLQGAQKENPDDTTVNSFINQIKAIEMSQTKNPTISCCMIVKNEEIFLEKCLESIKDYVDEIIIVDTGSTDKTVDIAERYTDKVYFHPWEGSFSKARNQALSYATSDWIFQIDGDEELIEGSGENLRNTVLESGPADAFFVNIISTYSNGKKRARHNFERLFRNNGVIHYEGIVHNIVKGSSCIKASKIELMHYGYDVDEKKAYEKFIRTTELLKKQIEENPQDPMPHHYLSASYIARGMSKEAADESTLAIDLAEQQKNDHPLYIWTHHIAAMMFFCMGDLERAKEYSLRALKKHPEHLDSFYTLTMIAAERKQWEDVVSYGDSYLKLLKRFEDHPDQAGLVVNNTMKEGPGIHLLMGHAQHAFKSHDLMSIHYQAAHNMADEKWQVWWNAGCFHMDKSQDLILARRYLSAALVESPEEQNVWYMLAKLNKKSELYQEEKQCLEKLVALGSQDIMILNRLATLRLESDELVEALEVSDLITKLDPSNYSALCTAGIIYKRQNIFDRAIEMFTKALEVDPQSADLWIHLGEISLRLDRFDEARIFFERMLFLQPESMKALLFLCEIELKQGRIEKFIGWCDSILKILSLNRNITINSMDDLIPIMLDINFELKEQPENISQARKVLSLIPSDFHSFFHSNAKMLSDEADSEKREFVRQELQTLLSN
jgi:glycosyltransferase involved in cell wall biosynthesis/Tfp pilus assembly protein PilF